MQNGSTVWINSAPFAGRGAFTYAINRRSDPYSQYMAYRLCARRAYPESVWPSVLNPATETTPVRSDMLSPASLPRYTRANHHPDDTLLYLAAISQSVESDNLALNLRIHGAIDYYLAVDAGAVDITETNRSVDDIIATAQRAVINVYAKTSLEWLKLRYSKSIERPVPGSQPPAPVESGGLDEATKIGVGVGAGVGGAVLLLGVFALVAVLLQPNASSARRKRAYLPYASPECTLLVTDVQGSTSLWELLPAEVMQASLQLHDAVIRRLLSQHGGYESATESATALRRTCRRADLMVAEWPVGLLEADVCRPVHAIARAPKEVQALIYGTTGLGGSIYATGASARNGHAGGHAGGPASGPLTRVSSSSSFTSAPGGLGPTTHTGAALSPTELTSVASCPYPRAITNTSGVGATAAAMGAAVGRGTSTGAGSSLPGNAQALQSHGRPRSSASLTQTPPQLSVARRIAPSRSRSGLPVSSSAEVRGSEGSAHGGHVHTGSARGGHAAAGATLTSSGSRHTNRSALSRRLTPPPPLTALGGPTPPPTPPVGEPEPGSEALHTPPAHSASQHLTAGLHTTLGLSTGQACPLSEQRSGSLSLPRLSGNGGAGPLANGGVWSMRGRALLQQHHDHQPYNHQPCNQQYQQQRRGWRALYSPAGAFASPEVAAAASGAAAAAAAAVRSGGGGGAIVSDGCDDMDGGLVSDHMPYDSPAITGPAAVTTADVQLQGVSEPGELTSLTHSQQLSLIWGAKITDGTAGGGGDGGGGGGNTEPLMRRGSSLLRGASVTAARRGAGARSLMTSYVGTGNGTAAADGCVTPVPFGSGGGAGGGGGGGGGNAGGGRPWGREAAAGWMLVDALTPGAMILFRGLRVRMGLHSGVREYEIARNRTSGRFTFSGACIRLAKAVADAAHGGVVLLSDTSAGLLLSGPELVASLSAEGLELWHLGRVELLEDLRQVELYQLHSAALAPRLALQLLPRVRRQLLPGLLGAPAGPVALVRLHVAGLSGLRATHPQLAAEVTRVLETLLLESLPPMGGYMSEARGGGADGIVAAFAEPLMAVAWALCMQADMLAWDWSPELLRHEAFETIEVEAAPGSVALLGGSQTNAGQPLTSGACDRPLSGAVASRGGSRPSSQHLMSGVALQVQPPASPTVSGSFARLRSGGPASGGAIRSRQHLLNARTRRRLPTEVEASAPSLLMPLSAAPYSMSVVSEAGDEKAPRAGGAAGGATPRSVKLPATAVADGTAGGGGTPRAYDTAASAPLTAAAGLPYNGRRTFASLLVKLRPRSGYAVSSQSHGHDGGFDALMSHPADESDSNLDDVIPVGGSGAWVERAASVALQIRPSPPSATAHAPITFAAPHAPHEALTGTRSGARLDSAVPDTDHVPPLPQPARRWPMLPSPRSPGGASLTPPPPAAAAAAAAVTAAALLNASAYARPASSSQMGYVSRLANATSASELPSGLVPLGTSPAQPSCLATPTSPAAAAAAAAASAAAAAGSSAGRSEPRGGAPEGDGAGRQGRYRRGDPDRERAHWNCAAPPPTAAPLRPLTPGSAAAAAIATAGAAAAAAPVQMHVLFRGPLRRLPWISGMVGTEVCRTTGRLLYRGRVAKHLSKLVSTAQRGQVMCTYTTASSISTAAAAAVGISISPVQNAAAANGAAGGKDRKAAGGKGPGSARLARALGSGGGGGDGGGGGGSSSKGGISGVALVLTVLASALLAGVTVLAAQRLGRGTRVAARLYRRLARVTAPFDQVNCLPVAMPFVTGNCLMAVGTLLRSTSRLWIGIRAAWSPAPPAPAPYGRARALQNGSTVWINSAPFAGRGAFTYAINRRSDPYSQYMAYRLCARRAYPESVWPSVLNPATETTPVRSDMLSPASLPRYTRANHHPDDTLLYLAAISQSVESDNLALNLRIHGAIDYYLAVDAGAVDITETNRSVDDIIATAQRAVINVYAKTSLEWLKLRYSKSIERPVPGSQPPAPVESGGLDEATKIGVGVGAGVGGAVLLLGVFALVAVLLQPNASSARRKRAYLPYASPECTLLVTDVQGSTSLWELLPAEVMQASLQLHDAVIRRLLSQHGGYESATESATALRRTCRRADLMVAEWPVGLLEADVCRPVHAIARAPKEVQALIYGTTGLGGSIYATGASARNGHAGGHAGGPASGPLTRVSSSSSFTSAPGGLGPTTHTGAALSPTELTSVASCPYPRAITNTSGVGATAAAMGAAVGRGTSTGAGSSLPGNAQALQSHGRPRSSASLTQTPPQLSVARRIAPSRSRSGLPVSSSAEVRGSEGSAHGGHVHTGSARGGHAAAGATLTSSGSRHTNRSALSRRLTPPPPLTALGGPTPPPTPPVGEPEPGSEALHTPPAHSASQHLTAGLHTTLGLSTGQACPLSEQRSGSLSLPRLSGNGGAGPLANGGVWSMRGRALLQQHHDHQPYNHQPCNQQYQQQRRGWRALYSPAGAFASPEVAAAASGAAAAAAAAVRSGGGGGAIVSDGCDDMDGGLVSDHMPYDSPAITGPAAVTTADVQLQGVSEPGELTSLTHSQQLSLIWGAKITDGTAGGGGDGGGGGGNTEPLMRRGSSLLRGASVTAARRGAGARSLMTSYVGTGNGTAAADGCVTPVPFGSGGGAGGGGGGGGGNAGGGRPWGREAAAGWMLVDALTPGAMILFRGLRVRMGLHSGVREYEIARNRTSGRFTFSGACIRLAKAVADAAHGGVVLLSDTSAGLLLSGPELVASLSAEGLELWHLGRVELLEDLRQVELYQLHSAALAPRLALQLLPRVRRQLLPGLLGAPAGPVALVRLHVAGLSGLRATHPQLAAEVTRVLETLLLESLPPMGGYMSEARGGGADGIVAAFAEPLMAVAWALCMQADMLAWDWSPELLRHEAFETIEVEAAPGSVALLGGSQTNAGQPLTSGACDRPLSGAVASRGGSRPSSQHLMSGVALQVQPPASPTVSGSFARLRSGGPASGGAIRSRQHLLNARTRRRLPTEVEASAPSLLMPLSAAPYSMSVVSEAGDEKAPRAGGAAGGATPRSVKLPATAVADGTAGGGGTPRAYDTAASAPLTAAAGLPYNGRRTFASLLVKLRPRSGYAVSSQSHGHDGGFDALMSHPADESDSNLDDVIPVGGSGAWVERAASVALQIRPSPPSATAHAPITFAAPHAPHEALTGTRSGARLDSAVPDTDHVPPLPQPARRWPMLPSPRSPGGASLTPPPPAAAAAAAAVTAAALLNASAYARPASSSQMGYVSRLANATSASELPSGLVPLGTSPAQPSCLATPTSPAAAAAAAAASAAAAAGSSAGALSPAAVLLRATAPGDRAATVGGMLPSHTTGALGITGSAGGAHAEGLAACSSGTPVGVTSPGANAPRHVPARTSSGPPASGFSPRPHAAELIPIIGDDADGGGGSDGGAAAVKHVMSTGGAATTDDDAEVDRHTVGGRIRIVSEHIGTVPPAADGGAAAPLTPGSAAAAAIATAGAAAAAAPVQMHVLFRGPLTKAAVDFGMVGTEVCRTTGRLLYRGRVAKHLSKLVSTAQRGQVMCTYTTASSISTAAAAAVGISISPVQNAAAANGAAGGKDRKAAGGKGPGSARLAARGLTGAGSVVGNGSEDVTVIGAAGSRAQASYYMCSLKVAEVEARLSAMGHEADVIVPQHDGLEPEQP
ncbi:hypothetical protein HYH03_000929 [Edaphochlamys debaryana]|uniref:Guanylate cyclase domain-containing protein n=1 Tax=Edaphochlamys debaryana TaxID=47281 RepID=A0A835YHL2_9CHLO|nr:hypothetical protein HYH03_000929 [Edaphochlamys debaryana]|eukprot:KAG2501111.1 hypothetical protein HYH03_000929 [Edaphochlamys debaryana]